MRDTANTDRLLREIITMLVDSPNEVCVTAIIGSDNTMFQVSVAPGEAGQIIGRQGLTARSLRVLLTAMGSAAKTRYSLDILDNQNVSVSAIKQADQSIVSC